MQTTPRAVYSLMLGVFLRGYKCTSVTYRSLLAGSPCPPSFHATSRRELPPWGICSRLTSAASRTQPCPGELSLGCCGDRAGGTAPVHVGGAKRAPPRFQKVPFPLPALGKLPVPALLGHASLLLAAVIWMSPGTLLSCLPVAGEKRREGREAEAGEIIQITPPRSCVGSGMDG